MCRGGSGRTLRLLLKSAEPQHGWRKYWKRPATTWSGPRAVSPPRSRHARLVRRPGLPWASSANMMRYPRLDHGCGHNLLAISAVGAGVGLAPVINDLSGVIQIHGTPAEEGPSGKTLLLRN